MLRASRRLLLRRTTLGHRLETARDECRPARLMARADAPTVLAVEVLVEEHEVLEVRVGGIAPVRPVARTATVRPRQEDAREPRSELGGDLFEVQVPSGADGTFHLERVAVVVVVALERFD